jgi:hypothetical protein
MAKKVTVEVDVETNVEGSIAQLKALKKELKNVAAGSEEFKKIYNQIDDLEDKIKSAKNTSADWIDSLESAGGPLGAVGGALNKLKVSTQSFGAALKATGIGIIVGLLGAFAGALSQSDDTMKKFEPILIAFEQIMNGLLEALQPIIDGFIELAIKVMPYVTQAFKVVYSAVTAVFQSLGKLGGAIVKLFKGDFSGAWEDAKSAVTSFSDNYDSAVDRFEKGASKQTKTQKKNLADQKEAADKALAEKLKRLEAEDKLDEAQLEKMKAEALALAITEQQKLDVEKAFAQKSRDLLVAEIEEKQKLYKKNSAEYKGLQADKIAAETEYLNKLTGFGETQKKLNEDAKKSAEDFAKKVGDIKTQAIADELARNKQLRTDKYQQDLDTLEADKEFIKKSEEEKQAIRINLKTAYNNDLKKLDDDAKIKQYEDDLLLLTAQQRTLMDGTQAFLDNSIAIENTAYNIKVANAKDNKTKLKAIEIEHEANIKDIRMKAALAEKSIQLERLNVIAGIGNSLAQLAGKNKALAIAAIAIEKAAAIGSIIVNTQIANIKALAASPLTAGMPWIAINNVAGALAVAATVASGVKAVQDLNAVNIPGASASGGGAGGGAATMPSYGGAPSASTPQIQTQGGANPATQISQTIQNANQMPIRAYVVSNDITNHQALDRKTNRGATFGLG